MPPCLFLYKLVSFYLPCVFFTQNLFQKKTQPSVSFALPCATIYFVFISCILCVPLPFSRPSRDHPERLCRVSVPFVLVPFFLFNLFPFGLSLFLFRPPKGTTLHSTLYLFYQFTAIACINFLIACINFAWFNSQPVLFFVVALWHSLYLVPFTPGLVLF